MGNITCVRMSYGTSARLVVPKICVEPSRVLVWLWIGCEGEAATVRTSVSGSNTDVLMLVSLLSLILPFASTCLEEYVVNLIRPKSGAEPKQIWKAVKMLALSWQSCSKLV